MVTILVVGIHTLCLLITCTGVSLKSFTSELKGCQQSVPLLDIKVSLIQVSTNKVHNYVVSNALFNLTHCMNHQKVINAYLSRAAFSTATEATKLT